MKQPQEAESALKEQRAGRFSSEIFSWLETLMGVLVVFVIVFTFFVRLIGVQGESMEPTLQENNLMLVSNLGYTPTKGDIIIVRKEAFYGGRPIVKRIIATEGDVVYLDPNNGDVSVNGEVLNEPYINEHIDPMNSAFGDMEYPLTIPAGGVFVMGDNRNHSSDSRRSDLGVVDERYVIGHVLTVIYPLDKIGTVH